MLDKLKKWFSRSEDEYAMHLPEKEKAFFILKLKEIEIGVLSCENGLWSFKYSEEFKYNNIKNLKTIIGFSDIDKTYKSETLWPFFRIRIPGLKQPKVKEILKNENINILNEVELLKRFGKKTIANPYSLFML